jgi:hypothetical protein
MKQIFQMKQIKFFALCLLFLWGASDAMAQLSPTVLGSWGTGIYRSSDPRSAEFWLTTRLLAACLWSIASVKISLCLISAILPHLA